MNISVPLAMKFRITLTNSIQQLYEPEVYADICLGGNRYADKGNKPIWCLGSKHGQRIFFLTLLNVIGWEWFSSRVHSKCLSSPAHWGLKLFLKTRAEATELLIRVIQLWFMESKLVCHNAAVPTLTPSFRFQIERPTGFFCCIDFCYILIVVEAKSQNQRFKS